MPRPRAFATSPIQGGKDRIALAACMRADRQIFTMKELSRAAQPVLVVCGENDTLTGPAGPASPPRFRGAMP